MKDKVNITNEESSSTLDSNDFRKALGDSQTKSRRNFLKRAGGASATAVAGWVAASRAHGSEVIVDQDGSHSWLIAYGDFDPVVDDLTSGVINGNWEYANHFYSVRTKVDLTMTQDHAASKPDRATIITPKYGGQATNAATLHAKEWAQWFNDLVVPQRWEDMDTTMFHSWNNSLPANEHSMTVSITKDISPSVGKITQVSISPDPADASSQNGIKIDPDWMNTVEAAATLQVTYKGSPPNDDNKTMEFPFLTSNDHS